MSWRGQCGFPRGMQTHLDRKKYGLLQFLPLFHHAAGLAVANRNRNAHRASL
jgi:hypothetical protein